jgi:hypothetical protein
MFGEFNFDRMNETDVRENIVSPLLKELQYRHSTPNDVITEQTLRYPKNYIGRKKKKDPELRGKADYILEVDGRIRWVIEVKSPNVEIGIDDIEQAYSYAFHPEVRAIYFVVTNGKEFKVFRTIDGPNTPPILTLGYSTLNDNFHSFTNILSPESLKRDYPDFVLDTGKPLSPGFRSFAKIEFGKINYSENSLGYAPLKGMNIFVSEGAIQRLEEGGIVAYLKTESPFQQMQELNKMLGMEAFEIFTTDEVISENPSNPTVFSCEINYVIPKGTPLFDFTTGGHQIAPIDMDVKTYTEAKGYLSGNSFSGEFGVSLNFSAVPVPITMNGIFEIKIG